METGTIKIRDDKESKKKFFLLDKLKSFSY